MANGEGRNWLMAIIGWAVGALIHNIIIYFGGSAVRAKVLPLLSEVNVSHMNPKYVSLEGQFTGKLESGAFWANDFILQDESGYVACLYNQPFGFIEALWGWMQGDQMIGRPVRVTGWFRRFNAPYLEIDSFTLLDTQETKRCYWRHWAIGTELLILIGATLAFVALK